MHRAETVIDYLTKESIIGIAYTYIRCIDVDDYLI